MNQENHQSGFDGSVGALDDEYRDIFAVKKVAAERAVAGGSEKQVAVHFVTTLERYGLACARECPELFAVLENARGLKLEAADFGQVAVKLKDVFRLDYLVARRHDGQWGLAI
ncbi:Uncharacterised protein [Burkholderia pseudomallei]|nr:Uncharacterised protein [Burkholderia pseudomallei]VCA78890.1 Uncharacterised protein [Burkholderia pseudomallei]VCA99423.1 Uncharacterised protein [Burkholderia pseudomallei]VCB06731.1 Uncharacterised protein [Burkholderia pseudomallei]VCB14443.1 Uncharacterised protein [Burkholderia pseudomallei]